MKYYLLLSGDSEKDAIYETNLLGEESFGKFYPSVGFMILKRIVDQKPDVVKSIKIKSKLILQFFGKKLIVKFSSIKKTDKKTFDPTFSNNQKWQHELLISTFNAFYMRYC